MTVDQSMVATVVTYNRPAALGEMLRSVAQQTVQPRIIVVVDNSDTITPLDESACRGLEAKVEVVRTARNIGPAGGFQEGLRVLSSSWDWEWALLLDDDDPLLHASALERLLTAARCTRETTSEVVVCGLVGGTLNRRTGRLQTSWGQKVPVEVDYIGGGYHPLVHRDAMEGDSGPFNPELFFGLEELDAGLRLQARGYRIVAHDDLAFELGYASRIAQARPPTGSSSARRYYSWRNVLHISRSHGLWLVLVASALRIVVSGLYRSVRSWSISPALLAGEALFTGLSGRLGPSKSLPKKASNTS